MEFRTFETGGCLLDEMSCGDMSVRIARIGAEMVSFADAGGGILHRDGDVTRPASGWANHATVMGYYLHRLWNGESLYRGKLIKGGNHGFLRSFSFEAPVRLPDGLAYRVPADRVPPDAYPLRVSLELTYRLAGRTLSIEFCFLNEEPELEAHVSFGLHPGFAVRSLAAARILLPPGRYVRHYAPGNFLDGRLEELDFPGGEFPYPKPALPDSFLVGIEEVPSRVFRLEDGDRAVSFDFSEVPYVTFWSDADDFICIEPCWGLPDSNPPVAFEKKVGIQAIPARGELRRKFSITIEA